MYNCMFSRLINSEIIADPLKPIIIKLITVCARRNRFQNWKRSIKSINNLLFFCIWTGTRARTYTSTLYPFHLFVCSAFQSQIRRKKTIAEKKECCDCMIESVAVFLLQQAFHDLILFHILSQSNIEIESYQDPFVNGYLFAWLRPNWNSGNFIPSRENRYAFEHIRQVHGMVGSKSGPNHHINRDHY